MCFHYHKRIYLQQVEERTSKLDAFEGNEEATMKVGDREKLKEKKREFLSEKMRKSKTLKKRVVKKGELPNLGDKGQGLKAKCDDVHDGNVLIAKSDDDDDWVINFVRLYHICIDKSIFARVMAYEHERVILPNSEQVVIEATREVHLKMHNGIVRKLKGVRYIPKMMNNLISLRRLVKIGYTMKT